MKGNDEDGLDSETERLVSNTNINMMGDVNIINNTINVKEAETETTSSTGDLVVVTEEEAAWGTLEELLLACAVNRHGTNSWDSIATELQIRQRHTHFYFSPDTCRRKYLHLKRRFSALHGDADGDGDALVQELRKLRVQQLKRDVYKHDVSILALQNKVKVLEQGGGEKKKTINSSNNNGSSSSLPAEKNEDEPKSEPSDLRTEPDRIVDEPAKLRRNDSAEDRSVNESNSNNPKREPDPEDRKTSHASRLGDTASESKPDNSNHNNNSNNNNNNNNNRSSESKKKRRRRVNSSSGEEGEEVSPANKRISVKSQPLIRFLDSLLSHKHASVFHRRLPSQETEKYRNVVRQHMDLDTLQFRLDRGIYCESHPKFYRDLLLVFTNALLFYRKSSAEHIAARELRKLVMDEIALRTHKPKIQSTPNPHSETQHLEPVVKKPRSSTTMVVCRRRTSMQGLSDTMKKNKDDTPDANTTTSGSIKNSNNNNNNIITISKAGDVHEEKPKSDLNQNQKKVDGGGSSSNSNALDGTTNTNPKKLVTQEREKERERSSLGRGTTLRLSNNNNNTNKKAISKDGVKRVKMEDVNSSQEESSKVNNVDLKPKATTPTVLKKQGVANFLKRINQNSPSSQEKASNNNDSDDGEQDDDDKFEVGRKGKTGKKTAGNARKNSASKEADVVVTRRISGRKGEKEAAASSRTTGRPPKRKAAMTSGGTPDSAAKGGKSSGDKSRKKPRR